MAKQAQHLIDLSLAKITQSRYERRGVSLHKNLLVATVLQKAKCMFMEEISHVLGRYQFMELFQPMWGGGISIGGGDSSSDSDNINQKTDLDCDDDDNQQQTSVIKMTSSSTISSSLLSSLTSSSSSSSMSGNSDSGGDKENEPPTIQLIDINSNNTTPTTTLSSSSSTNELTYFDLDKNQLQKWQRSSLKRRKESEQIMVADDEETDDNDANIIKKRLKSETTLSELSTIADDTTTTIKSDDEIQLNPPDSPGRVEIERITSLVSIFNFSGLPKTEHCSTQASETTDNLISQRTTCHLAMTAV